MASFMAILTTSKLSSQSQSYIFCGIHTSRKWIYGHMAKIHQEQHFIKNMQVVSLNRVHSTHSCETNKCRIFKPFFFVYQIKGFLILLSKFFLKKINLRVRFLPLKIAFFEGFENDNILSSKSYTVTKSGISSQRKLGS